jgi:hypothetical protein
MIGTISFHDRDDLRRPDPACVRLCRVIFMPGNDVGRKPVKLKFWTNQGTPNGMRLSATKRSKRPSAIKRVSSTPSPQIQADVPGIGAGSKEEFRHGDIEWHVEPAKERSPQIQEFENFTPQRSSGNFLDGCRSARLMNEYSDEIVGQRPSSWGPLRGSSMFDAEYQDPPHQDLFESVSYAFPKSRWSPSPARGSSPHVFEPREDRLLTSVEVDQTHFPSYSVTPNMIHFVSFVSV